MANDSLMYFSMASLSGHEMLWKEVDGAVVRTLRRKREGSIFTKHLSQVMILLRNRGQVGGGVQNWDLNFGRGERRGSETVGVTMKTPVLNSFSLQSI